VNQTQQHIISKAHQLFMRFGFKAVTVDEIAKNSGISKKTLYENYVDKEEILFTVLDSIDSQFCVQEEQFQILAKNAIEEALHFLHMLETTLRSMNANCIPDLQKYYPKAFTHFKTHQMRHVLLIQQNIKRGIKEGLYRKGLNIEFTAWYRVEMINFMLQNADSSQNFDPVMVQIELLEHFLYGISTLKGHALIEEQIQKLKKKKK
jgi:TetR/AcrR family transcriptional regulator, cholesterol catabolism regulator